LTMHLTKAESETLRLLSLGLQNKQAADVRKVSVKTVEKHRTTICRKLHCEGAGLLPLIEWGVRLGLRPEIRRHQ